MNKYLICILMCISPMFSNDSTAQNVKEVPHFVMAYVDDFYRSSSIPNFPEYHKLLFRVENDSIHIVDTLNACDSLNMDKLIHFSGGKFFYYEESNMYKGMHPNLFSVLDYSGDTIVQRVYNRLWDTTFHKYRIRQTSLKKYHHIFINNEKKELENGKIEFGINKYFDKSEFNDSDFQRVYNEGISGMESTIPFNYVYWDNNFDQLKLTKARNYDNRLDAWIDMPNSFKERKDPFVFVRINNRRYFIATGQVECENEKKLLWIYYKNTETWDTINVPGTSGIVKNYEDWLYGTKVHNETCLFEQIEGYDSKRSASIYNNRNRFELKYGKSRNLIPYTGKLYLIHIPSKKTIIWDTNDRDSEIIRIIDEHVFYRVHDSIYKVNLDIEKKKLNWSTKELIISDKDIIPYVHWMFYHTKSEVVEKWINKPKDKKGCRNTSKSNN